MSREGYRGGRERRATAKRVIKICGEGRNSGRGWVCAERWPRNSSSISFSAGSGGAGRCEMRWVKWVAVMVASRET